MNKNLRLKLTINADGNARNFIGKTNGDLSQFKNQADKTNVAVKSLGSSLLQLARYSSIPLSGAGFIAALNKGDQFRLLEQRVRNATAATGDFAKSYDELFAIAQRTSSAFDVNVSLFESIARTAPEIGATTEEVLTLTETLQNLGKISGASQTQMSNAMLQFGQAMSGGVLRAEEFNSILENTPEIAARIASGMDMTVGQLRLAVLEGNVLSEKVFAALLSQSEAVAHQAAQLPQTIAQAMTELDNAWSKYIGESTTAASATDYLADTIQAVAANLDTLTTVGMAAFITTAGHATGKVVGLTAAKLSDTVAARASHAAEVARLEALKATALAEHRAAVTIMQKAHAHKVSMAQTALSASAEKALKQKGHPFSMQSMRS
ncbi:MAG: tape measure protein [Thiomicrospira sp.]|jgi:tape measure domain-containing protein|nr:tape measure protein [Thiomicrospira sp.]